MAIFIRAVVLVISAGFFAYGLVSDFAELPPLLDSRYVNTIMFCVFVGAVLWHFWALQTEINKLQSRAWDDIDFLPWNASFLAPGDEVACGVEIKNGPGEPLLDVNAELVDYWRAVDETSNPRIHEFMGELRGREHGTWFPAALFWFENNELITDKIEIEQDTEAFLPIGFSIENDGDGTYSHIIKTKKERMYNLLYGEMVAKVRLTARTGQKHLLAQIIYVDISVVGNNVSVKNVRRQDGPKKPMN